MNTLTTVASATEQKADGSRPRNIQEIPKDDPGCELDYSVEGKSRYEAQIVANRLFWSRSIGAKAVRDIQIEVGQAPIGGEPVLRNRRGRKIAVKRGCIEPRFACFHCEDCMEMRERRELGLPPRLRVIERCDAARVVAAVG